MFWNRVVSWDGASARYQSNEAGRWYTVERNGVGVWVLRVSESGGSPGAVEYRHNCGTLNRAKEIAEKIREAERERQVA